MEAERGNSGEAGASTVGARDVTAGRGPSLGSAFQELVPDAGQAWGLSGD